MLGLSLTSLRLRCIHILTGLDAAAPAFSAILNEKLKDTAVKQEQERHLQIQKSALRAFVALSKLATPSQSCNEKSYGASDTLC